MSATRALAAPQTACRCEVELPDEGAWDFRTTDRLTTTANGKSLGEVIQRRCRNLCY